MTKNKVAPDQIINESDDVSDTVPHRSVLQNEVVIGLQPTAGKKYLDGTLGAGGHAQAILEGCAPDGMLIGLDVDTSAIDIARLRLAGFTDRIHMEHASYTDARKIVEIYGWQGLDGIILDLGVSSMQIDQAQRGFSFQKPGALDMRFDQSQGQSAAEMINTLDETTLADILWRYGEERLSRRIASAIINHRPIHHTDELSSLIRKTIGNRNSKINPATRTFQALRIAVNKELINLESALPELINLLNPQGRIAVISFHSLEDRIVKSYFNRESSDCICPPEAPICTCKHKASIRLITRRPIIATNEEIEQNPRARSAKMRIAEKLATVQAA